MSSKSLFWKCLDVRLGPIREPVWKLALGDEFPLVQRYLAPVPGLSPIASCERSRQTACNYRIVEHQDGSLVGICDEGRCPRRIFDRAELIRFEPQDRRIMEEVGRLLRLPFNPAPLGLPGASLFLGNLPGTATLPVQILFTRQSSPQDFRTFVERQILADRAPFILLSPTLRHMTPEVAALLQRRDCRVLALDGGILLGPLGLRATDSFLTAWRSICGSYVPAGPDQVVEEPPPVAGYALIGEGATWRMDFLGHQATIPDMRGMHYLARLLNQPDLSFSPIDLQEDLDPAKPVTAPLEGLAASVEGDGGIAATDRSAQFAYARKVAELKAAADDARDSGRELEADEIEAELDEIRAHLRKVTGKGRRVRVDSRHERARKAVTKALNVALTALESRCAPAAKYITPRIRKGNEFTYTPALGEVWRVRFFQKK